MKQALPSISFLESLGYTEDEAFTYQEANDHYCVDITHSNGVQSSVEIYEGEDYE